MELSTSSLICDLGAGTCHGTKPENLVSEYYCVGTSLRGTNDWIITSLSINRLLMVTRSWLMTQRSRGIDQAGPPTMSHDLLTINDRCY